MLRTITRHALLFLVVGVLLLAEEGVESIIVEQRSAAGSNSRAASFGRRESVQGPRS